MTAITLQRTHSGASGSSLALESEMASKGPTYQTSSDDSRRKTIASVVPLMK